jgi:uncharacterized protein (TIGR00730 family)
MTQQKQKTSSIQTLSEEQYQLLQIIQREYQKGMLALNSLGPQTVTVYGGSMISPDHVSYKGIVDVTTALAKKGWGVVSGGGPGMMSAALEGAVQGGGKAIAFCIDIPGEPPFGEADVNLVFSQFSVRKYFLRQSDAYIFAPGGLGTLDELMEILTLMKTHKFPIKPVFLYDSSFWQGYMDWFQETLLKDRKVVASDFIDLFSIVDTTQEIIDHLYTS